MNEILSYLETHGISYCCYKHPPVYACEEANKYLPDAEGQQESFSSRSEETKLYLGIVS